MVKTVSELFAHHISKKKLLIQRLVKTILIKPLKLHLHVDDKFYGCLNITLDLIPIGFQVQ